MKIIRILEQAQTDPESSASEEPEPSPEEGVPFKIALLNKDNSLVDQVKDKEILLRLENLLREKLSSYSDKDKIDFITTKAWKYPSNDFYIYVVIKGNNLEELDSETLEQEFLEEALAALVQEYPEMGKTIIFEIIPRTIYDNYINVQKNK